MFSKSSRSIIKGETILNFIFSKLFHNRNMFLIMIIFFAVPVGLCYLAGYLDNTLQSKKNFVGVIDDYTLYGLWLVVFLVIGILYKYSIFAKEFLLKKIDLIIDKEKLSAEEISNIDMKLERVFGPKGVLFTTIYISLIIIFIFFHILNIINAFDPIEHYGKDIWHSWNHIYGFFVLKIINLIYSVILLAVIFYKFCSGLFGFTWLFMKLAGKNAFIIKPLAPDNAAGLKILSDLAIYFMYMVLPFFLIYLSMILRGTEFLWGQNISFFALILLMFVTFFLPLGAVHRAMKRSKETELEFISTHFNELNNQVKKYLNTEQYDISFINKVESLKKLDYMYSRIQKMPVWPFNIQNLGRILTASLIPILMFLIDLLLKTSDIYKIIF